MRAIAVVLVLLAVPALGLCQGEQAPPAPAPEEGAPAAEEGAAGAAPAAEATAAPAQPAEGADQGDGQVVLLNVTWPGADLSNTAFRVFSDRRMRRPVDVFPAPAGSALAVLRPGEYYVMAIVDVNGNNLVDAGDGFGFYGVSDLSGNSQPEPLKVAADQLNTAAITILMTRGGDGRLIPLPSALEHTTGRITGSLLGVGGASKPTLLLALPIGMQTRPVVAVVGEDGSFDLQVPAGRHRLIALADADGGGTATPGDLVATAGAADAPITVEADAETTVAPIAVSGETALPEGLPPLVAGQITGAEIPEGGTAAVAFCTDASLRNEAFSVVAGPDGRFAAVPQPGTYYLRVTIDEAGDGALGVGDMLGFYGVTDLLGGETPVAVSVGADALRADLNVPISACINEDGRLGAVTPRGEAATTAPGNAGE